MATSCWQRAQWWLTTLSRNLYHLSHADFARVRDAEQYEVSHPHIYRAVVEEFRKSKLVSYDGISWFQAFLDLVYVMVIFKIDEILLDCSPQDNRKDHLQAAVNVYLVAFSFFVLFFYTRHRLDQYSCAFMTVVPATSSLPACTYPLLQSDLFHRVILATYGLGTFIMTMNVVLLTAASTTSYGGSSSSSSSNSNSTASPFSDHDLDSFVGGCKFYNDYSVGFAGGFILTRGLLLLLALCLITLPADPTLRREYRGVFKYQILHSIGSIVLASGFFQIKTHRDMSVPQLNRLNVSLLVLLSIWELAGEVGIWALRSLCVSVRTWRRAQRRKKQDGGEEEAEPWQWRWATWKLRRIDYLRPPQEVQAERLEQEAQANKGPHSASHSGPSSAAVTSVSSGATTDRDPESEPENHHTVTDSDHSAISASKPGTSGSSQCTLSLGRTPSSRYRLFYDASLIQDRLSLFFLLVLGESLLGLLYKNYDPHHSYTIGVQLLVYMLLTSTAMQFFETVDRRVQQVEVEIEDVQPNSGVVSIPNDTRSNNNNNGNSRTDTEEMKQAQYRSQSAEAVAMTPLHPHPQTQIDATSSDGADADASSAAGRPAAPVFVSRRTPPPPPPPPPSHQPTSRRTSLFAHPQPATAQGGAAPATGRRTSSLDSHALLSSPRSVQVYLVVHQLAAFALLVATCGLVGLYLDTSISTSSSDSSHHHTATPTFAPTVSRLQSQVDIDVTYGYSTSSATSPQESYYYYTDNVNAGDDMTPPQSLSQWQLGFGLCCTEALCVFLRYLHTRGGRIEVLARRERARECEEVQDLGYDDVEHYLRCTSGNNNSAGEAGGADQGASELRDSDANVDPSRVNSVDPAASRSSSRQISTVSSSTAGVQIKAQQLDWKERLLRNLRMIATTMEGLHLLAAAAHLSIYFVFQQPKTSDGESDDYFDDDDSIGGASSTTDILLIFACHTVVNICVTAFYLTHKLLLVGHSED